MYTPEEIRNQVREIVSTLEGFEREDFLEELINFLYIELNQQYADAFVDEEEEAEDVYLL